MIRRALLALALLLVAIDARAETCNFTTSGNWTTAAAYSGTDDCTLDATDSVVIATGVVATITTGSTVSMTVGAVTVSSGGSLVIERGGNLAVPNLGLTVSPGGTFTPRGNAVSYGDATPSFVTALRDGGGGDLNTAVPVGKVIHCPGVSSGSNATSATAIVSDCTAPPEVGEAGTLDEVALCWPDANVNADLLGGFDVGTGTAGQQFYAEWLAQIAAGDVVVFWDSTNKNPSRDVNAHYEVTFVNTQAANRCIGLSVRQGSTQNSCAATAENCLLADRDIATCTTTAAYDAGERTITCDAAAVTVASQHAGRNLTCPADKDGSGTVEPGDRQSVTITETTAADVLRLMPGGLAANVPITSVCWIDYGWKAGDKISVYKPAKLSQIQNPTCTGVGAPVACCGQTGGGAGFGQCGTLTCGRGATCDFDFTLTTRLGRHVMFPTSTVDNSWLREVGSGLQLVAAEGAGPFTRLQITSPAWEGADDAHGIGVGGNGTTVLTDSVIRHWGDDAFCANACDVLSATNCDAASGDTDTSLVYNIKLTRMRAEYMGCVGGSCGLLDECGASGGGGGAVQYDVTDFLAIDAHERDQTQGGLYFQNDDVAGSMKLRNVAMVASGGPLMQTAGSTNSRAELRNWYDIGRNLATSSSFPTIRAHLIQDASLIDVSNTGNKRLLDNVGLVAGAGPVEWKRILFLDPDHPAAASANMFQQDDAAAATTLEDVAVISPNRTGQVDGLTLWRLQDATDSTVPISFRRITVGMRPGETTQFDTGFWVNIGAGGSGPYDRLNRTLRGALTAFLWRTSALTLVGWTVDTGAEEFAVGPWCDVGSSTPFSSQVVTGLAGTASVRDVRQAFVDPAVGNFEPVRGSLIHAAGCGARKVGARDMWALRVLGHDIYGGFGDTWKVKGGASGTRGPRATP